MFAVLSAFIVTGSTCSAQTLEEEARNYYQLGNLYYQQGKYRDAQEQYQKALEMLKDKEQILLTRQRDAGASAAQQKPAAIESAKPAPGTERKFAEYLIGEEDVLAIAVWQNEDLNQEAIVRPDGMISFPLIGDIRAAGLSIPQLDLEITERLKEFIKLPEVSISLRKVGGSKVIVLGEISRPGVYNVAGTKTILEAIGQAGGFTPNAVPSSVVLIRGGFKDPKAERINLSKALKGRDVNKQNVVLQATDIVFVPKKFIANLNYFLSQVVEPLAQGVYMHKTIDDW